MTVAIARFAGHASRINFSTATFFRCSALPRPQCFQSHVSSRHHASATSKVVAKPSAKASLRQPPTATDAATRPKASSYTPLSGKIEPSVVHEVPQQKITLDRPTERPQDARERIAYATGLERKIDQLYIKGTPVMYAAPKRVGSLLTQSIALSMMLTGLSGLLVYQYLTAMNDGLPLWVPAINMVVTGGLLSATIWVAIAPCKLIQTMRAVRHNGQACVEVMVKSYPLLPTKPKRFVLDANNMAYPPAVMDVRHDMVQYRKAVKARGEAREANANGLMKSLHRWGTRASLARHNAFIAVQMCFFRHGLANLRHEKKVIGKLDARGDWHGAVPVT